jgi:hypothetical protein
MSWFILNFGRALVADEKCVGREKSNGESFSIHIRNGRKTVSLKEIFLTNSCNMFHVVVQGTRQGGQIRKVKLRMPSLETFTSGLPTFVEAISYSQGKTGTYEQLSMEMITQVPYKCLHNTAATAIQVERTVSPTYHAVLSTVCAV